MSFICFLKNTDWSNSAVFIELLAEYKRKTPNALAILAPQKQPITYYQLCQHLIKTATALNQLGITNNDRVALVMNNGPEMATAFIAISSIAVCVPVNPMCSLSEFKMYLSAVKAKAIVMSYGISTEATRASMELEIKIITVKCENNEAGIFDIIDAPVNYGKLAAYSKSEDVALILFTSGTTGKPKIVPLTHQNIHSCTKSIISSLLLSPRDRCLNVMPLFHSGGLVMSLLSTLFSGGSVICTTGFVPSQFFSWLCELSPTWYSAVTTIHQSILQQWEHIGQPPIIHSLRFIRCGSAALPSLLAQKMESVLQIPIVEGYGSTEAVSQIAVNPLPPGQRKPGSAGKAVGCKVAIMDQSGNLLPVGVSGEIVIQGESVFSGYENDSASNLMSFCNGWFRTGDQGYLDLDGYLYINGRIKEIINCGGAKVSPREVEEVILTHPAVQAVVAFAIPHQSLSEAVAVAIVRTKGAEAISQDKVQRYASKHLIYYKVPHRVVFVENIPIEFTGKVNRIGMAEKLGITMSSVDCRALKTSERDKFEHKIIDIWKEILNKSDIGIDESFFSLGGDSLSAVRMSVEIETVFGKFIPVSLIYEKDTIEKLIPILACEEEANSQSLLVPLQTSGDKSPLFTIDTIGGNIPHYRKLAIHLGKDQPVYALRLNDDYNKTEPETIELIASNYVREIRGVQPTGPYYLAGYSLNGILAFEVAQQLYRQGQTVALLAMFDTINHKKYPLVTLFQRTIFFMRVLRAMPTLNDKIGYISSRLYKKIMVKGQETKALTREQIRWQRIVQYKNSSYVPLRYPGQLTIFRAMDDLIRVIAVDAELGWKGFASEIFVCEASGDHVSILSDENIEILARNLKLCILRANKMYMKGSFNGKLG